MSDVLKSPVVVDGILSDEKLAELLALQTEYPELDFKDEIDLGTTEGKIELAKDVGAMQVRGGYIIGGVDGHGAPTGNLDNVDDRPFDESSLTPMLLKWLPEPLELRTRVARLDGHVVALIYVGRHPAGCAFFHADGLYKKKNEKDVVAFRAGDVFWRDGTRSVRVTQQGLQGIIERRVTDAKSSWLEEQQEIRQRERLDLETAYESRRLTDAPLAAINLDMDAATLNVVALELIRKGDVIALRHLLIDAVVRVRTVIASDDFDTEMSDLLDKLTCVAATLLAYEEEAWFDRVVVALAQIYAVPLRDDEAQQSGNSPSIRLNEIAPRVWLMVIERVLGLGALAVRRNDWRAVRALTLQRPEGLIDHYANWLRHGLTMASRAQHLKQKRQDGTVISLSLLSVAREDVARLDCLRPDGLAPDDDSLLTSLAQFDLLSNLVAIDGAEDNAQSVFYTNFARVRQDRIQPIVERVLTDISMRSVLFTHDNADLALALQAIGEQAQQEGWRFDGFSGWDRTPVERFIVNNLPPGGR